ncbi:alpha-glucosidase [Pseudalkalibacillus hwajinpoensis]|uniref:glycoside hydrolase family 13 protein n=1 Tax=Guptibacillus hwajinpoensis TaxID=208199 RepID=UPI00325BD507
MSQAWWKEAVVYQIYPRSFKDSNGDGIGDIQGVISKLDYLQDLGVNVIWICPIYSSPNDDNGYDISDFTAIMSEYGTMADFDKLLSELHKRDMKLIMDLVINHTSDEHPWFIESKSSKDNPYRDYYIWHPGKGGQEPNNWASIFEGSAWELDRQTKEYYMHVFSRKQPDLNWENPNVRNDLYNMINWWLDKGIDGFRIDAISHIKKVPEFPDVHNPLNKRYASSLDGHRNREGIQVFLEELKRETFDHYDIMTVGEANGVTVEEADDWVGEVNGKFNMIFQFEHNDLWQKGKDKSLDIHELKSVFTRWQNGLHGSGWNALFLENHDLPRSVSVWGNDKEYHNQSCKCLATLYFLMQGTPFIYQGQEIGMTNVQFESIEDYDDVAIKNLYQHEVEEGKSHQEIMEVIWKSGRDNSRTPMQWSAGKNAGFTEGSDPWLKLNPNYKVINVEESITESQSIYHFYKNLISLRKSNPVLIYGKYNLILPEHEQIYAYTRNLHDDIILIITNLFAEEAEFQLPEELKNKSHKLLITNYEVNDSETINQLTLKPYEARVYKLY